MNTNMLFLCWFFYPVNWVPKKIFKNPQSPFGSMDAHRFVFARKAACWCVLLNVNPQLLFRLWNHVLSVWFCLSSVYDCWGSNMLCRELMFIISLFSVSEVREELTYIEGEQFALFLTVRDHILSVGRGRNVPQGVRKHNKHQTIVLKRINNFMLLKLN